MKRKHQPGKCCCVEGQPICNPFGDPPVDFSTIKATVTASFTGCPDPPFPANSVPCPDANVTNYELLDRIGLVGGGGAWHDSTFADTGLPNRVGCLAGFEAGIWEWDNAKQLPSLFASLVCGTLGGNDTHVIQIFRNINNPGETGPWWQADFPRDQILPLDTPLIVPINPNFIDPGHECLADGDATIIFELK